jgi:glycosyltransferase involved in cell wall biosynthesis
MWMKRAAVLAVPSVTARDGDREGLPTVLLEAMAASLPAVGSNHGGIPEAIVDGETGFVVPEGHAAALARALANLLGSPELRQRMGAAARRRAEQNFDTRVQVAALEQRYDALLRQTSPLRSR